MSLLFAAYLDMLTILTLLSIAVTAARASEELRKT
jgi:hypothetical protein